ncbi:hypothetical protein Hanom_Chr15g01339531 [Helianthus anomalus]
MLAEIIEEPEPGVEEVVEEEGEIHFGISYDEDSKANGGLYALRSVGFIPPDMMSSFAGLFNTQSRYGGMQQEEPKKEPVEDIIDVKKEMTAKYFAEIANKAMMLDLKEVVNKPEFKKNVESESEKVECEKVEIKFEIVKIKTEIQCKCTEQCKSCTEKDGS